MVKDGEDWHKYYKFTRNQFSRCSNHERSRDRQLSVNLTPEVVKTEKHEIK